MPTQSTDIMASPYGIAYTANSQTARPMLDFMLAVESPVEWHQQVICS